MAHFCLDETVENGSQRVDGDPCQARCPLDFDAAFANGVVYTMSGEHSPNTPLYLGYRARAINATTGAELWTLLDWSASGLGTSNAPVAIADGYYTFVNAYDGQIYALGKGPSRTTVDIENDVIEVTDAYGYKIIATINHLAEEAKEEAA